MFNFIKRLFRCRFNESGCAVAFLGCRCGKGGGSTQVTPAPAPAPTETTAQTLQAHLDADPKMAALNYQILTDPNYGVNPTTAAITQARRQNFQGESAVQDQLLQNVLQQLQSPTGYTPEQQAALDSRRGLAQSELVKSQRTRANLGGGLFGGRAAGAEARDVSNLQNQFATEDIGNQERARNNAIQAALPALQILFPEVGITAPQFTSAAPSGDAAYGGALQARGQDTQAAIANAQNAQANRTAMWGALGQSFGAVGSAASAGGFCWVASVIFEGGWDDIRTHHARHFIGFVGPKWFCKLYTKHGQKVAEFIHNKPFLKSLIKPLFSLFAVLGEADLNARYSNIFDRSLSYDNEGSNMIDVL